VDWFQWHNGYEQYPALVRRLKLVQAQIRRCIDACPAGEIHIVSVCSGDGRDLLGAISEHPRRDDIRALMVELHPGLVDSGKAAFDAAGLSRRITFINDDAASAAPYLGTPRADIVLMCGMLGLVHPSNFPGAVRTMQALCKEGGHVVWTRRLDSNGFQYFRGLNRSLKEEGFRRAQMAFTSVYLPFIRSKDPVFAVSTHRYTGQPVPLPEQGHLFKMQDALVQ
jgi:hypothetical protein